MKRLQDESALAADGSDAWAEVRLLLDEAIQRLADADREVLLLHYFEGLSFQEVAARLKSDMEDGWSISYVAGVNGSGWQVYSGTREGRLLYAKSISSCKETQAHFRIEYLKLRRRPYDSVVGALPILKASWRRTLKIQSCLRLPLSGRGLINSISVTRSAISMSSSLALRP
jgi:hypothetical protein